MVSRLGVRFEWREGDSNRKVAGTAVGGSIIIRIVEVHDSMCVWVCVCVLLFYHFTLLLLFDRPVAAAPLP